mmetsp:Transcript_2727/g.5671  ORF Transcript_2727/g.5671 Transcript_2727/m.5671 type:complete len:230 (-) Transcript_2727:311-1000(-)
MSASPSDATCILTSASPEPIMEVTPIDRVCTPPFVTCTTARVDCGMLPSSSAPHTSEMAERCSNDPSRLGLVAAAASARLRRAASMSLSWPSSSTLAAVAEALAINLAIIPPTPPRPLITAAASESQSMEGVASSWCRRTRSEKWRMLGGISFGIGLSGETPTPSTSTIMSPTLSPALAAAPFSRTARRRPLPYIDMPSSLAESRAISMQSSSKEASRHASTSSSMVLI